MQSITESDAPWRQLREGLVSATPAVADRDVSSLPADDLLTGWWAVVYNPLGDSSLAAALMRGISEHIAEHGEDATASMQIFWGTTTTQIQFDIEPTTVGGASTAAKVSGNIDAPSHTRLAHELKGLTGLSAETLGRALGVTREQFQRWLSGSPISDARHGQLIHLHTMAADVTRRLGAHAAKTWWQTPHGEDPMPAEILRQRRADRVFRLVSALPDMAPVVNGVLQSLPVQQDIDDDAADFSQDGPAWSPYGDTNN
jgi:hypothetical protein